jgi:hypothetical protein
MYDANDQQCKMTTVYCNENESFTYDRKKKEILPIQTQLHLMKKKSFIKLYIIIILHRLDHKRKKNRYH